MAEIRLTSSSPQYLFQYRPKIIPAGFAVSNALPGETVQILQCGIFTSDDGPLVYQYLDGFSNDPQLQHGLTSLGFSTNQVVLLVYVIDTENLAHVLVNFPMKFRTRLKSVSKKVGDPVLVDDMAGLEEVTIPELPCNEFKSWAIVVRIGWRTAFAFDFSSQQKDTENMVSVELLQRRIADVLCTLIFRNRIRVERETADQMYADGWFPFIRLREDQVAKLVTSYREQLSPEGVINEITGQFDEGTLSNMLDFWETKPALRSHIKILRKGVDHYLNKDFVSSISVLLPRVEGIFRLVGTDLNEGIKAKIRAVQTDFRQRVPGITPLLPEEFARYLDRFFNRKLAAQQDDLEFGRHAVAHGVLPEALFQSSSALQVILAIDQLAWYV